MDQGPPYRPHLNMTTSAKTLFPKEATHVLGVKTATYLLGDTVHPTTDPVPLRFFRGS